MELNKKNSLSGNVVLKKDDKRFQLVYATQLYGSLFGVFGRFNAREVDNTKMELDSVDFQGINYKGPINLGIKEISLKSSDSNALNIELKLQADETGMYTDVKRCTINKFVTKNQLFVIERELVPMVDPNLEPDILKRAFKHGKFDSEFFVRDGLYVKDRPKKCYEFANEDRQPLPTELGPAIIGSNCKIGTSMMIF